MNGKQKIALLIGIFMIVAMGLCPPWRVETGKRFIVDEYSPSKIVSGGYAFLFDPPKNATGLDLARLFVQWATTSVLTAAAVIVVSRRKDE